VRELSETLAVAYVDGRAAKASLAMPLGGHAGFAGVAVCIRPRVLKQELLGLNAC
jgi:hypothetical protein